MKVLINVSTLRNGGGLQVGINLVKYCLEYSKKDIQFYYLINNHFYELVKNETINYYLVEDYPSNILNFKNRFNIKKYIKKLNPDLVYSVGSPSYLNLNEEVIRLTNPWIIYNNQIAYNKISKKEQLKLKLSIYIKKLFLNNSKYVITQTDDAKKNIVKNLNKKEDNVYVVPNVYSYNLEKYKDKVVQKNYTQDINILVFSANYFHKNIDLCIKIAKNLKERNIYHTKFVLTIPADQFTDYLFKIKDLGIEEYFDNKGKVNMEDVPQLYSDCHILFLPTLLEVFSVTFLEAMIFKLPIITTDLSFNKDVCKDAALYFDDYFNGSDAVELILKLINVKSTRNELIYNGNRVLKEYSSNNETYKRHIEILKDIYERRKC